MLEHTLFGYDFQPFDLQCFVGLQSAEESMVIALGVTDGVVWATFVEEVTTKGVVIVVVPEDHGVVDWVLVGYADAGEKRDGVQCGGGLVVLEVVLVESAELESDVMVPPGLLLDLKLYWAEGVEDWCGVLGLDANWGESVDLYEEEKEEYLL